MGKQRKKRKKNKRKLLLLILILVGIYIMTDKARGIYSQNMRLSESELEAQKPEMEVDLLTVNEYSRCGRELKKVNGIVIHYTANPGSTAKDNRDYFENLKNTHATMASSHFVIGLEGEIVQCIPSWEISYASNERNKDTISIECCHQDESGVFTKETYLSMVNLTAWLCNKFGLTSEDVIRHYDVTGKICPKYFVEDEKAWAEFKAYVQMAMEKGQ